MTGLTTIAGSIPLVLSSGAGAETRSVIGIVVLAGVFAATLFTLFIVPVAYWRGTRARPMMSREKLQQK